MYEPGFSGVLLEIKKGFLDLLSISRYCRVYGKGNKMSYFV
jgi:hypothetical protein